MKSIINEIKLGKSKGDIFEHAFNTPGITNSYPKTKSFLLSSKDHTFTLKAKVGDIVFYKRIAKTRGVYGSFVGIVSKVTKNGFSYLVQGQEIIETEGTYNGGTNFGTVLEGFVSMKTEAAD